MSTRLDINVMLLCYRNILDAEKRCSCIRSIYAAQVI